MTEVLMHPFYPYLKPGNAIVRRDGQTYKITRSDEFDDNWPGGHKIFRSYIGYWDASLAAARTDLAMSYPNGGLVEDRDAVGIILDVKLDPKTNKPHPNSKVLFPNDLPAYVVHI